MDNINYDWLQMVEWTQIMSIEFLDDADLQSFMVDRFLRHIDKGMK